MIIQSLTGKSTVVHWHLRNHSVYIIISHKIWLKSATKIKWWVWISHMAGHASVAGVWPAMSTNVVHMAQLCGRRGEIANPLSQYTCCPRTRATLSAPPCYTILGKVIWNSGSVAVLFVIRMGI